MNNSKLVPSGSMRVRVEASAGSGYSISQEFVVPVKLDSGAYYDIGRVACSGLSSHWSKIDVDHDDARVRLELKVLCRVVGCDNLPVGRSFCMDHGGGEVTPADAGDARSRKSVTYDELGSICSRVLADVRAKIE